MNNSLCPTDSDSLGFDIHATVRVARGTATHCACGGLLEGHCDPVDVTSAFGPVEKMPGPVIWRCADCGREYE